ncbi:MAG: carbonic anhydrase family protein [bacterium]|nr:carbonic anhydrase family protein [bacterium]
MSHNIKFHSAVKSSFRKTAVGLTLIFAVNAGFAAPGLTNASHPDDAAHEGNPVSHVHTQEVGHQQSPVDLSPTMNAGLSLIDIDYASVPLNVINDGHTVQVKYPAGSKMSINGQSFELMQFHFHAPSEYTIEGKRFDMEVHLVHKDSKGNLGVIGILIEEGVENKTASKIWDHFQSPENGIASHPQVEINASGLLPKKMDHYELMGSLTTPPYTEGVQWYVMKEPIQLSTDQIAQFKAAFKPNARSIQNTNGRPIVLNY